MTIASCDGDDRLRFADLHTRRTTPTLVRREFFFSGSLKLGTLKERCLLRSGLVGGEVGVEVWAAELAVVRHGVDVLLGDAHAVDVLPHEARLALHHHVPVLVWPHEFPQQVPNENVAGAHLPPRLSRTVLAADAPNAVFIFRGCLLLLLRRRRRR